MCYALPGPRCTPHATERRDRARLRVETCKSRHPTARFDPESARPVDQRLTHAMIDQARAAVDYECSAGGIRRLADLGQRLKRELMTARADGSATPASLKQAEYRLRDVFSRYQDARQRYSNAKEAENARRRERWNAPEAVARREVRKREQARALALIDRMASTTQGATS